MGGSAGAVPLAYCWQVVWVGAMIPTTFGGVTGMVTLSVDGGVWSESAVATLTSVVAENSAAVTVWLPEQFIVAVGASVAGWAGVHVSDATLVSLRVTP